MDLDTIIMGIPSLLIGLVFLGYLYWGTRTGQFESIEEGKDIVFRKEAE